MRATLNPLVIGITGGSGSGKTALALAIAERFQGLDVALINQDRYYRDWSHLPPAERAHINFDEPAALDMELLVDHLAALRRGGGIEIPTYSFDTHCREVRTTALGAAPLILVEGILLFHDPALVELFHLRVFVDAPADVRLARRILRDIRERGRRVEDVVRHYLETVRAMHERYVEPQRSHAHVVVLNEGALSEAVGLVEAALRSRLRLSLEAIGPARGRGRG